MLGAGEVEVFAQDLEQRLVDGCQDLVRLVVDVEDEVQLGGALVHYPYYLRNTVLVSKR
jgi:hypothetical protein